MKIKLENFNYYGFDHKLVCKTMEGELTYVGSFCIRDEYAPWAVYKNAKPNRAKKHCDYMLLNSKYVSGINKKEMEEFRYQTGIRCNKCNDIVYSINRHDCHECKCGDCFIDGGRDYDRIGYKNEDDYELVKIDLLKGEVVEEAA